MGVFRNRPLAFSCVVAALFALAATAFTGAFRLPLALILFAVGLALLVVALARRRCGKVQTVAILSFLLSAVLLFGSWSFFDLQTGDFAARGNDRPVAAEGIVTERLNGSATGSTFAVSLKEFDGKRTNRRVLLSCSYLSALRAGDRVRFRATVKPLATSGNDTDRYRLADGFSGWMTCSDPDDCTVLSSGRFSFFTRLSIRNQTLSERLAERIGGREGGLAAALLLGNRSLLFETDPLTFRRAGISHLLALSGLHVGILIAAIDRFLRLLRVPRMIRIFPILLLAAFYLSFTGAAPSTARAVLMAGFLYLSFLFRRTYDSVTALSVALFLILALQPYAVADLGLWLSFLAAGSIVVFLPAVNGLFERHGHAPHGIWRRLRRMAKGAVLAICVGLFAFCATLPLSARFFGEVSVLSVPVTLLLSPFVTAALILSAIAALIPLPPILFLAGRALAAIRWIAIRAADLRGVSVLLNSRAAQIFVLLTAISLVVCAVVRLRRRFLIGFPLLLAVLTVVTAYAAVPSARAGVSVTYGNGTSYEYLLFCRGRRAVAVDCSGGNAGYAWELKDDLNSHGCTELEELILTHYHSAAATHLLHRVSATVHLRRLRLPVPRNADETAIAARIREEAQRLGIPTVTGDRSGAIGGLTLQTIHDAMTTDPAVTVSATYGAHTLVWYNPKARSPEQSVMQTELFLSAETLIVGFHGVSQGTVETLPATVATTVICGGREARLTVVGAPPGTQLTRIFDGKIGFQWK